MISVLFVAKNSVYKTLGVDCWDEERDALKWPGGNAIVVHPPCRLFSQLRHMSTAPKEEKKLAYWAVDQVRQCGGVLEHPAMSRLWKEVNLPKPGNSDRFGLCVAVDQWWWGHRARKPTWLYVCGTKPIEIPLRIGEAESTCSSRIWGPGNNRVRGEELAATPPAFARWLIETAERCNEKHLETSP